MQSPAPSEPSKRDWTEDFGHENGRYSCWCCLCETAFFGHKRRVVCKECSGLKTVPSQTGPIGETPRTDEVLREQDNHGRYAGSPDDGVLPEEAFRSCFAMLEKLARTLERELAEAKRSDEHTRGVLRCMENDLRAQLADARRDWIDVKDRRPEKSGKYLVCIKPMLETEPFTDVAHYNFVHEALNGFNKAPVTHWMPLPQSPMNSSRIATQTGEIK